MAEEKHTHHHEHDHEHGHHHHHHHHEEGPLKPGEHPDWRTHVHAPGEHHEIGVNDYMTAVAAYRKTFASKEDVLEQTPDPAVREMIKYLGQLGHETEGKSARELTGELADILLEDLSRAVPDDYKTIRAMAPKERQDVWDKLDIIPISAYNEVFDAYHRTAVGTDGDWESLMQEFLRCGLAFCFTGVVAANIGTDVLFGNGHRATSKVNIGALKEGWVNIAVHGHLPTLVSEIVRIGRTPEMIELAKAHGAKGIQL